MSTAAAGKCGLLYTRGRLSAAAEVASRDITRLEDCGVVEAGAEVHKKVEH
jgi:hypothetical protein